MTLLVILSVLVSIYTFDKIPFKLGWFLILWFLLCLALLLGLQFFFYPLYLVGYVAYILMLGMCLLAVPNYKI